MSARSILGLSAALLIAASVPARADGPVPQAFNGLKAYQIVEQVITQRTLLGLTEEQVARLGDLSTAIRTEKHRFVHQGGKPHETRHVPMITREEAYGQVLAILTPEQQARLEAFNGTPARAPAKAPRKPTVPHGKP